jgi:hypothetical protein
MAAAPLPCAGHTRDVLLIATVVVVVGCEVVVVGCVVVVVGWVVVVDGTVVVVVVATVLDVVESGIVVVVVDGTVVVVVVVVVRGMVVEVVVVVGGVVAQDGRTGDVAMAGVSFTGRRIRSPLRPTARIAERRIQLGGPYFTQ